MALVGKFINQRAANALYTDIKTSKSNSKLLSIIHSLFKCILGGCWITGKISVYDNCLLFTPNNQNNQSHVCLMGKKVEINHIKDVSIRCGLMSKIIDIYFDGGVLSIRCMDAEALAISLQNLQVSNSS